MPKNLGFAPAATSFQDNLPQTNTWLGEVGDRLKVYSGTVDPALTTVPENQWIIHHNSTAGEVRIWTNIAGTLLKSAAFT